MAIKLPAKPRSRSLQHSDDLRGRFKLGGLWDCMYCVSVWVALVLYVLLLTELAPVVYILAGTGGAMLLHRYTGGDYGN